LIIKVQLFAHRNNSTCVDAKKHKDKERERIMQQYFVNGNFVDFIHKVIVLIMN
jgi:hypothetical protein